MSTGSDNMAVSWSEMESFKSNIVFETRIQMIQELNALIHKADEANKSPHYVSALRDAVETIMSYGRHVQMS